MVLQYSFKIGGTEVGDAGGTGPNHILTNGTRIDLNQDTSNGNVAIVVAESDIENTITLTSGAEIIISRGETSPTDNIVFRGNIKQIDETEQNVIILTCTDPLQKLKYDLFTEQYDINIDPEAGELSEIFKDIAEQGGFNVSRERSGTTAADITVDKFISNNQSRLNRMKLIQRLLNWNFYYDYNNDNIRLEPKGYTEYNKTLNVGVEIKNVPRWEEELEGMRNKITVNGVSQIDTRVDSFIGDGTTTEFELTFQPISVETTVDGTLQTLGIVGTTETYDYTLDVINQKIKFETPPGNTLSVICTYTTDIPTPVQGEDADSIARYGLTQHESYTFEDVRTVDDAEVRVRQLLEILSTAKVSTSLFTDEYNVQVGQKIEVVDSLRTNRSGSYIVDGKVITYGEEFDALKIGTPRVDISKIINTIDERLKNLEGTTFDLSVILRKLIALNRTVITASRDSFKLESRSVTNSFYLGHSTLGLLRSAATSEIDASENDNNGTWSGSGSYYDTTTTVTPSLQRLSCAVFNGTDDNILGDTFSGFGIADTWTRVFFVSTSSTSIGCIMDYTVNSSNRVGLTSNSGFFVAGLYDGVGWNNLLISPSRIDDGNKHFIVLKNDSGTLSMTVDGVAATTTTTNPTSGNNTSNFRIGSRSNAASNFFDGKIDEMIWFNKLIDSTTIDDIENNRFYKFHSDFANCKLWWAFDNPILGDRATSWIELENETY